MNRMVRLITAVAALFGAYYASANTVDFSTYSAGAVSAVAGYDLTIIDGSGSASASIVDDGSGTNVLRLNTSHNSAVAMLSSKQTFSLSAAWSVSVDFSVTAGSAGGPFAFGIYNSSVVDADGLSSAEAGTGSGASSEMRAAIQMLIRPNGKFPVSYIDSTDARKEPGFSNYDGDVTGATRYTLTFECDGADLVVTLSDIAGTTLSSLTNAVTNFGSNITGDSLKFAFGDITNDGTRDWTVDIYKITTIPEPATISLFILAALGGFAGRKWIQK